MAVDLQVNGVHMRGGHADYSVPGMTAQKVVASAQRWRQIGTGMFLPTVITSPQEVFEESLPAIAAAMNMEGGEGILGIAIEGPYLNPLCKGAHPAECMVDPTIDHFKRLQELAVGKIALVHVAPELPGALELIEHLTANDVVVSIAHCDIDRKLFLAAVSAGAKLVTHVCNGLPSTLDRAALKAFWKALSLQPDAVNEFEFQGVDSKLVQAILEQTKADRRVVDLIHAYLTTVGVYPMIIPDGCHITDPFIQVAYALAGQDMIITSDAAPLAHAPVGIYEGIFGHLKIEVRQPDGCRPELSQLCGSYWSATDCVNIFGATVDLGKPEALALCRDNALTVLQPALNRLGIELSGREEQIGDLLTWDEAQGLFTYA